MEQAELDLLLSPDFLINQIIKVHRYVKLLIRNNPTQAFRQYFVNTSRGPKPLAAVDLLAEQLFRSALEAKFRNKVRVEGEEALDDDTRLENETRMCVLIDVIDGTDLLQRGFSNWCSAIVVFNPQEKTIEGAFVALPGERKNCLYYATKNSAAFKTDLSRGTKKGEPTKLVGLAKKKALDESAVCMNIQRSNRILKLMEVGQNTKFVEWLRDLTEKDRKRKKRGQEIKFRFYGFAGNPMMVRLAEGDVDVVIELVGQAPHDVVAGAFIALRAGAVMCKPDGEEFGPDEIAEKLLLPGVSSISYVLAANTDILKQMVKLLN